MGIVSYIKSEAEVVRMRDPAMRTSIEILLYPGFKAILAYRLAHKLWEKSIISLQDGFLREQQEKLVLRFILGLLSVNIFLSTMEMVW